MKIKGNAINIVLAGAVALLAYLCVASIQAPMRFDSKRTEREKDVKRRLVKIRRSEESFRKANGYYCPSLETLVRGGWMADSLRYIPHSANKEFRLATGTTMSRAGEIVPLMECGAEYADYLEGLDKNSINAITDEANSAGLFPGLRIGSLTENNGNAGNWEKGK